MVSPLFSPTTHKLTQNSGDTINHFFFGAQMIVPGQSLAVGREKGDVEKDEEGLENIKALGQRMAWLLKKLYG